MLIHSTIDIIHTLVLLLMLKECMVCVCVCVCECVLGSII